MKFLIFVFSLFIFHPFVMADTIHDAARSKDTEKVKQELEAGADPNKKDEHGDTLLYIAAGNNDKETAELLLAYQANPYIKNENGVNAIRRATLNSGILNLFSFKKHDMDMINLLERGTIDYLIRYENIDTIKQAFKRGSINVNQKNPETGESLLHIAVDKRNIDKVTLLVAMGAKRDIKDLNGKIPLERAKENSSVFYKDIIKVLKQKNTSLLDEQKNTKTLTEAIIQNNFEEAEQFLKDGVDPLIPHVKGAIPPIMHAINLKDIEMLRLVLSYVDNAKDKLGYEHLYEPVLNGDLDIVKLLFDYGAKPNTKENRNPLITLATRRNDLRMVSLLIQNGVEINEKDIDGETSFYLAVLKEYFDIAKLLYNNNADPDILNNAGYTILNMVAKHDRLEGIKTALKYGANPNIPDPKGRTPIFHGIERRSIYYVRPLIKAGADLTVTDNDGKTPLRLAKDIQNEVVVVHLEIANTVWLGDIKKIVKLIEQENMSLWEKGKNNIAELLGIPLEQENMNLWEKGKNNIAELLGIPLPKKANKTTPLKKQEYQSSTLHKAVLLQKREEVELLLNSLAGAIFLDLQDSLGNTALHLAVMAKDRETGELLMRYNPILSIKNNKGYTAGKLAELSQNIYMIKLFAPNKTDLLSRCRDAFARI